MLRCGRVGLASALLLSARLAAAEPPARPSAVLEYRNGSSEPSCPSERDFRDHVVGRLGFDPFVPAAPRTLVVTLRDDKKKVRAEVVIRGAASGRRELEANRSECGELGDSVAIAVSMILDPLGIAAATPESPKEPVPLPPVVAPPEQSEPQRPPLPIDPEPEPRWAPSFEVTPQASIGRGPGVTLGGRLGAFEWRGKWGLGLEGMIESTPGSANVERERVSALFAAGQALGCYRARRWFFGCVVGALGAASAEVEGLVGVRRTLVSWAGMRAGVPLCTGEHLCLAPALDLVANVVRTRIHADGADVWTAPPFAVTLGLAVEVRP